MSNPLFRPSSLLRRARCPGSLALESTIQSPDEDDEYRAEGRLLHRLIADPSLPRDELKPSQLDLIELVEKAEREFLERILKK